MESELNEALTFEQATATLPEVRKAFLGGKAETKERIAAGTKLYKWTQHQLVGPKGITSWWSFLEDRILANGRKTAGLAKLQERAQHLGASDSRFHRTQFAVTRQWNQMTRPLVAELVKPVWGFAGRTSGQVEDKEVAGVYLIGGGDQVWIPNLTIKYARQVAALPYLAPESGIR